MKYILLITTVMFLYSTPSYSQFGDLGKAWKKAGKELTKVKKKVDGGLTKAKKQVDKNLTNSKKKCR